MTLPTKRPTEAWRGANLFEDGFGQVIIARFKLSGEVEAGVFLVDLYCLGVKNAFFTRIGTSEYEGRLIESIAQDGGKEPMSPACARRLIEGAVAYARNLGLEPHPDYTWGARVFGGIHPDDCQEQFVYGKDGKPLFIQNPHDSPAFVQRVMGALTRRLGEGGFHYVLSLGEVSPALEDEGDGEVEVLHEENHDEDDDRQGRTSAPRD